VVQSDCSHALLLLLWLQGCAPPSLCSSVLQHAYHCQLQCKEDARMRKRAQRATLSRAAVLVCCAVWDGVGWLCNAALL
jgi:hypothetical protein